MSETTNGDGTPAGLRANALTLSLTARDLAAAVAWYRDVLGLAVVQEYEREGTLRAVALAAGDVRLLLNQDDGGRGWDRVKGEGFSFQFVTDQDVDELASQIRERGGSLEAEPADMPWGVRMMRLKDLDGYRFAISRPL